MNHVVTFSYGVSSWATAKIVAQRFGAENVVLLHTDTMYEDADTYAWGQAAAQNVGASLVSIADGRDVWGLFKDERMIGNTRVDVCSRVLKREMLRKWLAANCDPAQTVVYFGIHASEADRFDRVDRETGERRGIKARMAALGWTAAAPLCEPPLIAYQELHAWALREGLWQQRMYALGFAHANCGGRCVKQGQAGWLHLLKVLPERFKEVEQKEQAMREYLGKDVAILRDRRGGTTKSLPLKVLRERHEAGEQGDLFDIGGCNCFAGDE